MNARPVPVLTDDAMRRFVGAIEFGRGCWLWKGAVQSKGYGTIGFQDRTWLAHRLAYEAFVGPIRDGLYILHRCDTPRCVRPGHLFLGTQADNMADMSAKGRAATGVRNVGGRKTHCPRSHEYNAANTYIDKRGIRHCRPCGLLRYHAKRAVDRLAAA